MQIHNYATFGSASLLGVRESKDVDGRNKSGHDDVDAQFLPRLRGRVGRGPAAVTLARAATDPLWHRFARLLPRKRGRNFYSGGCFSASIHFFASASPAARLSGS